MLLYYLYFIKVNKFTWLDMSVSGVCSLKLTLIIQGVSIDIIICDLVHSLFSHAFFFFPGPPYFFMSRQYTHNPQLSNVHPSHSPHLSFLFPAMEGIYVHNEFLHNMV